MATPIAALRSAGASLTPSPVTATTWPARLNASTNSSFWSGSMRAKTRTLATSDGAEPSLRSGPATTRSGSPEVMPTAPAMAAAVAAWSPVTIVR